MRVVTCVASMHIPPCVVNPTTTSAASRPCRLLLPLTRDVGDADFVDLALVIALLLTITDPHATTGIGDIEDLCHRHGSAGHAIDVQRCVALAFSHQCHVMPGTVDHCGRVLK